MALNYLEIPEAVPFRFVDWETEMPPVYHLPTYQEAHHYSRLREWDHKTDYGQKWQTSDNWQFQCAAYQAQTSPSGPTLTLQDEFGRVWHTWAHTFLETVPGDNAVIDGLSYPLDRFHFFGSFDDVPGGLPAGRYWLFLSVDFLPGNITKVSEPLDIAADWPNTVFIRYHNARNDQHTIFRYGDINARFTIRVEGHIYNLEPDAEDTQYESQQRVPVLLDSKPARAWKFGLGYPFGIAEWVADKVNRAFSCSDVSIEGGKYMKAIGAKWEIKRVKNGNYPLVYPEISIRETNPLAASQTIRITPILLWDSPGAYPYSIHTLEVGSVEILTAKVIEDATDETAFLAQLNSYYANVHGLQGVFTVVSDRYYYTNGLGETYATGGAVVLPSFFAMTRSTTALSANTTFTISGTITVVDWGEGDEVRIGDAAGSSENPAVTYAVGLPTTKTIRLFHNDNVQYFNYPANRLTGHSGTFPQSLEYLGLPQGNISTFTATSINKAVLETLDISNENLTSVVGFAGDYPNLDDVNFANNQLSVSQVDALFNDFVNNTPVLAANGTFSTLSQTPAAAPTGASLTSRNALLAAGWTITTD